MTTEERLTTLEGKAETLEDIARDLRDTNKGIRGDIRDLNEGQVRLERLQEQTNQALTGIVQILNTHTGILREHTEILNHHTELLVGLVKTTQDHSIDLTFIKGHLDTTNP